MTSQRALNEKNKEITELKRRLNMMQDQLNQWTKWYWPIAAAVRNGDNLRAIAMIEEMLIRQKEKE